MSPVVADLEEAILAREWFYEFTLPSGRKTSIYVPDSVAKIHETRLTMLFNVLDPLFEGRWESVTCIDLASHQGYFSYHLAKKAKRVVGVDFQASHHEDATLIKEVFALKNCEFLQADVTTLDALPIEPADAVVMLGLLYNLEDPIGVLRQAKRLTKQILIVETQTTGFDMTGRVDSGAYHWGNEMQGIFGIFPGFAGRDGAATDIILYPSPNGLLWILRTLGFTRVEIVTPPDDAYEQLASGKRIMVAAHVG